MFLPSIQINRNTLVSDIVAQDYRAADVFRKYGIGYCCGGKWPVEIACQMNGIDAELLLAELRIATRTIQVSSQLDFAAWDIDFLVDYILHVHHRYLRDSLLPTHQLLSEFSAEHTRKFPWLPELEKQYDLLNRQMQMAMQREEEVLFPYIRQITHAHKDKEPYAALLVRTLRKPVEDRMYKGHEIVTGIITTMRELTQNYTAPENACTSHRVVVAKLKELDNDLAQHHYLEQSILFPRAVAIEKEVLNG